MRKKPFTKMLNQVKPDGTYSHVNQHGLCNWVFKSMPPDSHNYSDGMSTNRIEPVTSNMFGILAHFQPSNSDENQLAKDGKNWIYWGSDSPGELLGVLTDLRATILCFCAAINNEL